METRIDFETLHRPTSPNTYLLAPEGLCQNAVPDAVAPEIPLGTGALFSKLESLVRDTPNWQISHIDPPALSLSFIAVTRWLKFKDDVDVKVIGPSSAAGPSTLAIYSRSRVGYSDLGANKKRVLAMLENLTAI